MNTEEDLIDDAKKIVIENQLGSTALLQRKLMIGYNRAKRIMDELQKLGVVGPPNAVGSVRDVLVKKQK